MARRPPASDPLKATTLPLNWNGRCPRRTISPRLGLARRGQTAVGEDPLAVDVERYPPQRRRRATVGGSDPGIDADPDPCPAISGRRGGAIEPPKETIRSPFSATSPLAGTVCRAARPRRA